VHAIARKGKGKRGGSDMGSAGRQGEGKNKAREEVENDMEMRQGPRIGLFCKWTQESSSMELLTSLEADMEGVHLFLLCEEPRYQHGKSGALEEESVLLRLLVA